MTRVRLLAHLFIPILAAATPAAPQIPDGHYVTAHNGTQNLGTGGLFVFHPRNGSMTTITGLPPDLTGMGTLGQAGASSVAIMPDGTLVVGQLTSAGAVLYLHHLRITNGAATILGKFALGTGTAGRSAVIREIQVLGPDKVLICAATSTGGALGAPGPLANEQLGIVTLSTGAVQACPMAPMPVGWAWAVAGDGRFAYVALFDSATSQTDIWKVDCTQVVSRQLLISLPTTQITNLEWSGGNLLATSGGPLYTIDAVTGAIKSQCPFSGGIAFASETVTGMIAGVHGSLTRQDVWWAPPCGPKTSIAGPPPGGWGIPQGIAVAHDPIAYGAPTPPGGPDYRFVITPNAGGLPLVGNAAFSLSVANSTGGATAGAWLLALAPSPALPLPGLCIALLVAPAQLPLNLVLAPSPTAPAMLPLAIPNIPSFAGAGLFVQTVHVAGACLAASEGVRVTLL